MESRCVVLVLLGMIAPARSADPKPVRVSIMAGQSNMEGK
jgi:hypothetical protein